MLIATNSSKIDISVEKNTADLARKFSNFLKKGDIVFIHGEIGVGKTTFIRYLINSLQKKNNINLTEVTSPTFNLVNEYEIKNLVIQHYDLFRLKDESETKNLGLFDNRNDVLTLIEWPEKIKNKPQNIITLNFKYENNLKKRSILIEGLDNKKLDEIK